MTIVYDIRAYDLALCYLYGVPLTDPERARHADLLAQEIQRTICDYLERLDVRGQYVDTRA